mmetsp:Transcript_33834/g.77321  ORF Transcript_33834/g.77321 Transcript_33834/m.77321 type:complete len:375 (-) Transcript_33834:29-1153(-)
MPQDREEEDIDRMDGGGAGAAGARPAMMQRRPPPIDDSDDDSDGSEGAPPPGPSAPVVRKPPPTRDDDGDSSEGEPPTLPSPQKAPPPRVDSDSSDDEGPPPSLPGPPPKPVPSQVAEESSEDEGPPPPSPPRAAAPKQDAKEDSDSEGEGAPPPSLSPLEELAQAERKAAALRKQLGLDKDDDQDDQEGKAAQKPAPKPAPKPKCAPSEVFGYVKGTHIIFLVDLSGSMALDFRHGRGTRFDCVMSELELVLRTQMTPETKINLFPFKDRHYPWSQDWVTADAAGVKAAVEHMKSWRPGGGGTGLLYGTEDALSRPGVDSIYCLTDGCPGNWGDLRRFAKGVPITCITMGHDPATLRIMEEVAAVSQGELRRL